MKNFWSKILISVIMVAIFLAPVSASFKINDQGNLALKLEKRKALAIDLTEYLDKDSYIQVVSTNSNSVTFNTGVIIGQDTEDLKLRKQNPVSIYNAYENIKGFPKEATSEGLFICYKKKGESDDTKICKSWRTLAFPFVGSYAKNEQLGYKTGTNDFDLKPDTDYELMLWVNESGGIDFDNNDVIKRASFKTLPYNEDDKEKNKFGSDTGNTYSGSEENGTLDLGCGIFNLGGCIAQIFYTIWQVSASIARLAGEFLDFFVYYATNSSSYRNDFVEQAWAAIRDIANIFFIVALLYIAIKTILGLNVTDNKRLIGALVIVALVINFSLFFTKVVIDGTNILAKVFYNNITPKDATSRNADGTLKDAEAGSNGQKSISVGLIDKFDIQKLVTPKSYGTMGQGKFIFITFLLTLLTLYTAYIFFSIALLFVGRVVSLWISMIFSPIAFVSHAIPFKIEGFSWDEWLSELMKNAFLAPLFVFFLYIIILFAGFLDKIVTYTKDANMTSTQNFMQEIMSVIVPFIILFVFLKKAKEIATKYAGEMGKAITGAGAAVAGLAIGGGALGVAALGRGTVGSFMKGASTGDTATQRLERGESLGRWDKAKGMIGKGLRIDKLQKSVGNMINKDQEKVEHAAHARHELDKIAGEKYHGKAFKDLTAPERAKVQAKITQDHEAEAKYGKKYIQLKEDQKTDIESIISRKIINGEETKGDEYLRESRKKQTLRSSVLQSTRTGSYDVRGLASIVAKEQTKGINKLLAGLTGVVAVGMRSALKSTLNVSYGESQKSFLKDLGHTVSEALKGFNIKVDLSHVGEEHKESSHGGGHSGGHGGGGHH